MKLMDIYEIKHQIQIFSLLWPSSAAGSTFAIGLASSLALRKMLEVLSDPESGLWLSAAQVATAAFFQFLVEVLAVL